MWFLLKKNLIFSTLSKFGFEVVGLTLFEEIVIFLLANLFYLIFLAIMANILFKILIRIWRIIF